MKIIKFLKDWTLIIAIITGIAAYFVYTAIPALQPTHHFALKAIELLQPMLAAILLRYLSPRLHFTISHYSDLSFYLWAVALTLAMTVTTRTIVHADVAIATELGLVAASFISCLLQFWLGRKVGALYNDKITAGQCAWTKEHRAGNMDGIHLLHTDNGSSRRLLQHMAQRDKLLSALSAQKAGREQE